MGNTKKMRVTSEEMLEIERKLEIMLVWGLNRTGSGQECTRPMWGM